jgi:hypothetical protein
MMQPYGVYIHKENLYAACSIAFVRYTESIIVLKAAQDSAWHASALEGLATAAVIEGWLSGHGLVCPIVMWPKYKLTTSSLGGLF